MSEREPAGAAAGDPLVLVVPNFSEGRRAEVVDAIVGAMTAIEGVTLLNVQADPDHNRLDTTLIGSPDAVRAAALAGAAEAVRLIDMESHRGSHPRMGAVDVVPFIPVRGIDMDGCVELARRTAAELADTLSLPVYLYERAATVPERVSLADVRRGEFEGLRADVAEGRRLPDLGPHRIGSAGATAVGARPPLVAFNVYLSGTDELAAKEVARRVRERSGGLVHVRAIGFAVPDRGCVEVSMNLVDPDTTPPYRALELVRLEAARYGMHVLDTEVVGLLPQSVLASSAAHYLQLRGFDPDAQVIETLVQRVASASVARAGTDGAGAVAGFLDELAGPSPTPGGGAAAAVTAATGAALLAMVARLTAGRKNYEAVEARMREIVETGDTERRVFLDLAGRDSDAFDAVMAAYRLPKDGADAVAARRAAVQDALAGAAEVPLEVARRAGALVPLACEAVEAGNANAVSDGLCAAQVLHAAVVCALANVTVNTASFDDPARAAAIAAEAQRLRSDADAALARAEAAFAARVAR